MNIDIEGLSFVQTHDSDPIRYDVRDDDFKRVAYVEWDGAKLVCTAADSDEVLYTTDVSERYVDICLGHVADVVNARFKAKGECKKSKTLKVKTWKITGYKGWDDWDGPEDNNLNFTVVMDARFSKDDVQEIFLNRFSKKHRSVVIDATEIECFDVERNEI